MRYPSAPRVPSWRNANHSRIHRRPYPPRSERWRLRRRMRKACSGSSKKKSNPADGIPQNCAKSRCASAARSSANKMCDFLVKVADQLFRGRILEEKVFAVFLLEKTLSTISAMPSFACSNRGSTASAVGRITMRLVHYLIAPMMPARLHGHRCFCVGAVAQPLASAGGLRGADSGNAPEDVSAADHSAVEYAAPRRR